MEKIRILKKGKYLLWYYVQTNKDNLVSYEHEAFPLLDNTLDSYQEASDYLCEKYGVNPVNISSDDLIEPQKSKAVTKNLDILVRDIPSFISFQYIAIIDLGVSGINLKIWDLKKKEVVEGVPGLWRNLKEFIGDLDLQKLKAYMLDDYDKFVLQDIWAQLFNDQIIFPHEEFPEDVRRAWITSHLQQLIKDKNRDLQKYFVKSKVGVIVKGDLAYHMDLGNLILAVIDGLGIKSYARLILDRNNWFETLSSTFNNHIKGIHSLFDYYEYLPARFDSLKKSGTAILGNYKSQAKEQKFYVLVDELITLGAREVKDLNIHEEEGVTLLGYKQNRDLLNDPVGNIIIDCRQSPVIYGPSPRANKTRILNWLDCLEE